MRHILTFLLLLMLGASPAMAQLPTEDFVLPPEGGVYRFLTTWEDDYDQVCFYNESTMEEYGCVAAKQPGLHPVFNVQYCELQLTLMNNGVDLPIRAYALDVSGNRSEDSAIKVIIDFTPPSAPQFIIPE